MQIEFTNLQPVVDVVPATNLIVNANNADNTVAYTAGPNLGGLATATGLVAVDNNETIEFANKAVLSLNALAGDDTINFENTGAVPTGLGFIVASGGLGSDVIDGSGNVNTTPLLLFGGNDDDILTGGGAIGGGNDFLYGGLGNDTLVYSAGVDTFDGANNGTLPPAFPPGVPTPAAIADVITATSGFDTLLIRGTPGNDIIGATQNTPGAGVNSGFPLAVTNSPFTGIAPLTVSLAQRNPLIAPNVAAARSSVEEVRIEGGLGNDQIIVAHADSYTAATGMGAAPVLRLGLCHSRWFALMSAARPQIPAIDSRCKIWVSATWS